MTNTGNVSLDFSSISMKTLPQLFVEGVQKKRDKVAFYFKDQGIIQEHNRGRLASCGRNRSVRRRQIEDNRP